MDEGQASRLRLQHFITEESAILHKILCQYVLRAGLVDSGDAGSVAHELLNEVIVEAFVHAERLKADMLPRPWLLGIAANLIKREQVKRAKRNQREPLIRDLYTQTEEALSDDELFELLQSSHDGSLTELEANDTINSLLAGLTKNDSDVLRFAILEDFNGEALAVKLGISVNAARVRLHRALDRLRVIHRVGGRYD